MSGAGWSPRTVTPQQWHDAVLAAREEGYDWFDWLGCVDELGRPDEQGRSETLRVIIALRRSLAPEQMRSLAVRLPRDDARLDGVGDVFAGAGWHQREAAELFGVTFTGGDSARLLLGEDFQGAPLRKDQVLAARTAVPWPGGKEPGERGSMSAPAGGASPGRRATVPVGVPDPTTWGDRDPALAEATAAEVAGAAGGARVRRSRR